MRSLVLVAYLLLLGPAAGSGLAQSGSIRGQENCLTCHFGIVVPDGVELRVAREIRRQPQGRCIVFDDSFEHEVWNRAATNRYNVFLQFWHPDLTDEEIDGIQRLEQLPPIKRVIEQYLEGASALAPVPN